MACGLSVRVIEADDLPNLDDHSPDAYCTLTISESPDTVATRVAASSSKPRWNEAFNFQVAQPDTCVVLIQVWDNSYAGDDLIARLLIPVAEIPPGPPSDRWHPMHAVPGVGRGGRLHLSLAVIVESGGPEGTTSNANLNPRPARHVVSDTQPLLLHREGAAIEPRSEGGIAARRSSSEGQFQEPNLPRRTSSNEVHLTSRLKRQPLGFNDDIPAAHQREPQPTAHEDRPRQRGPAARDEWATGRRPGRRS